MYFDVEGQQFVDCEEDGDQTGSQDDAGIDDILLVEPEGHAEEEEKVKRTDHLLQQYLVPGWPLDLDGSLSVVASQMLDLSVGQTRLLL
jgi:hypothetical protein